MTTMTEVIDVAIDPLTAFTIFTDEFDQWWGRGPIGTRAAWRLVERRIEGGVGGRLVEDYGDEERVHRHDHDLGARRGWRGRPGDVTIEVTFEAHASGTRVRVTGTVPAGVDGTDQLSMLHGAAVVPRYLNRRSPGGSRPDYGRLHLALRSATPAATARWLADVFQLEAAADIPDQRRPRLHLDRVPGRHQLHRPLGRGRRDRNRLTLLSTWTPRCAPEARRSRGATIISPITEHGFRSYTAADCEGRQWVFAQSGPHIGH